MAKTLSLGCKMRKRLSDITNSQSHIEVLLQEENLPGISSGTDEDANRLVKENLALVKLLEERDKAIELNSIELKNLREGAHKLQVQNWTLAQTNSQFLAEINLARNKVKALQHEIMCKNALLKAKDSELQERMNEKSQKPQVLVQECKKATTRNVLEAETLHKNADEEASKPSETSRRPVMRSKSAMGVSAVKKTEEDKQKAENKRRRLRRQSARFKSQGHEDNEQWFEIEDIQLTMPNSNHQDGLHKPNTPKKEEEEKKTGRSGLRPENCMAHRSSIGRPSRRAAEKVHSYKEVPMNIKLRRPE